METTLYYFSATGNSLVVARDVARELADTEIIPIAKIAESPEVISDSRNVGIVFPVYMFGLPLIVSRFINKLKLAKGQYAFALATCGKLAGSTLKQADTQLKARGRRLSAGFIIQMPGNYTPLYGALPLEKQREMFEKEKEKVKSISAIIKKGRPVRFEKGFFLADVLLSGLIYNLCSPRIPWMDKSFWADGKCNGCMVCAKVCPVKNIRIVEGRPKWLGACEQCMACLQWCPQEAIQFGLKTSARRRYRNPAVALGDFIR